MHYKTKHFQTNTILSKFNIQNIRKCSHRWATAVQLLTWNVIMVTSNLTNSTFYNLNHSIAHFFHLLICTLSQYSGKINVYNAIQDAILMCPRKLTGIRTVSGSGYGGCFLWALKSLFKRILCAFCACIGSIFFCNLHVIKLHSASSTGPPL